MSSKKIFLFCLVAFPCLAIASEKHQTTLSADTTRTRPIPYPTSAYPVWLNTKLIEGHQQVVMQYHDPFDATGDLAETQLTTTPYDKFNPQWGPGPLTIYALDDLMLNGGKGTSCNGQTFLFTGDGDASGVNHLYIDCVTGFPSSPYTVFDINLGYSLQLTDVGGTVDYDVADYDIETQSTFTYLLLHPFYHYYEVVFTTALSGSGGGELHHLLFRPENMDPTGTDYPIDSNTFLWSWGSWSPAFTQYRTPRFFNSGKDIIFSASHSSDEGWELGGITASGQGEKEITDIPRDVVEPKVFGNNVVFGLASDGIDSDQLAYTTFSLSGFFSLTISQWCPDIYVLTESGHNRDDHDLNLSASNSSLEVAFSREREDNGLHDIYYAEKIPSCSATSNSVVTAVNKDLFESEMQLTCGEDDVSPLFMPAMNSNENHTVKLTDPVDIMLQENVASGLDVALVHLHNNPTGVVCDDCSYTSDGSPIDDPDGDLLRNDIMTNGTDCDNCDAVYNPDQTDSDADGIGDACEEDIPTDPPTEPWSPPPGPGDGGPPPDVPDLPTFSLNPSYSSQQAENVGWGLIFKGDKSPTCSLNRTATSLSDSGNSFSMMILFGIGIVLIGVLKKSKNERLEIKMIEQRFKRKENF